MTVPGSFTARRQAAAAHGTCRGLPTRRRARSPGAWRRRPPCRGAALSEGSPCARAGTPRDARSLARWRAGSPAYSRAAPQRTCRARARARLRAPVPCDGSRVRCAPMYAFGAESAGVRGDVRAADGPAYALRGEHAAKECEVDHLRADGSALVHPDGHALRGLEGLALASCPFAALQAAPNRGP